MSLAVLHHQVVRLRYFYSVKIGASVVVVVVDSCQILSGLCLEQTPMCFVEITPPSHEVREQALLRICVQVPGPSWESLRLYRGEVADERLRSERILQCDEVDDANQTQAKTMAEKGSQSRRRL